MIQKLIPRILNMESDESLVKPNEFVDAINVKIDGEEGIDFGVIKHADGNVRIDFASEQTAPAQTEVVTGFVEDESEDVVYIFCAGPNNIDSVYRIYNTPSGYRMNLLARSTKFDLDKDKLTVGNIVRTYDKSITETFEDPGTGFFGDQNTLTDFDPSTIVDYGDDEGEGGFVDLVIIPNINTFEFLEYSPGTIPSVPNHTIFVQNFGTNTGQVQIRYFVDVTVPGESYLLSTTGINGQVSGVDSPGVVFDIGPGESRVFTLSQDVLSGGTEIVDGWTWDAVVDITSPNADFAPQTFQWTVTLTQQSIGRGVPVYGPNPAIDAGDFLQVDTNQPSVQTKSYSITNQPGDFETTVDLTGTIYIQPDNSFVLSHNPDYTYLQAFDEDAGAYIVVDGDDQSSGLDFSIAAGDTFNFDLVLSIPAGVTEPYTDLVNITIKYSDETEGTIPEIVPTLVQSAPVSYQIVEQVVVDEENPPLIVATPTPGFATSYEWEPIFSPPSSQSGATYGGNFTVTNFGGEGAVVFTVEVINEDDSGIISANLPSLIECSHVNGNLSSTANYTAVSSEFQVVVPGGTTAAPFTQDVGFLLSFSTDGTGGAADLSIQSQINSYGSDVNATIRVTGTVADVGTVVLDSMFDLIIQNSAGLPQLEYRIYHGSRLNGSNSNPSLESVEFHPSGTSGTIPVSANFMRYDLTLGKNVNQIALEVFNSGFVEVELPHVELTNTKYVLGGGLPGQLGASAGSTYIGNSTYNTEYVNSNEIWMGYGSISKENHPVFSSGTPNGSSDYSANSQFSNAVYSDGWKDVAPDYGWQPNYYSRIDANLLQPTNERSYTETARANTSLGWFTPVFSQSIVMHNVMPLTETFDASEPADTDNYGFESRPITGWNQTITPQAGPSQQTLFSPWIRAGAGGDDFNTDTFSAEPGNIEVVPQDHMLQPGEKVYIIFNCNTILTSAGQQDSYQAILKIGAIEGSAAADFGATWRYSLYGVTNANSPFPQGRSSGKVLSGTSEAYEQVDPNVVLDESTKPEETYQLTSTKAKNKPKAFKMQKMKFSELSSEKAISRATTNRIDKNGRRY